MKYVFSVPEYNLEYSRIPEAVSFGLKSCSYTTTVTALHMHWWHFGYITLSILGSMMSHQRVIVGLSQSAPAVGWGSPLHAWLASVNWIGGARCLNWRYRYGARGMHYHIILRQYSQNCYTYNSVVKNTYSPCHKDACIKISIGNTEWLLRYKGVS